MLGRGFNLSNSSVPPRSPKQQIMSIQIITFMPAKYFQTFIYMNTK